MAAPNKPAATPGANVEAPALPTAKAAGDIAAPQTLTAIPQPEIDPVTESE